MCVCLFSDVLCFFFPCSFPSSFFFFYSFIFSNAICKLSPNLGEYGSYELLIRNDSCFLNTLIRPTNSYISEFYFSLFFSFLFYTWNFKLILFNLHIYIYENYNNKISLYRSSPHCFRYNSMLSNWDIIVTTNMAIDKREMYETCRWSISQRSYEETTCKINRHV